MNLYFLVEGKRTEKKVYPAWLNHLVPKLHRVDNPREVDDFSYYIFSGEGYPSLLGVHLANAVKDFNAIGKFDRLVVCLDVDDATPEVRVREVQGRLSQLGFPLNQLRVIPQECCIETWFLGNRKAVSGTPNSSTLHGYLQFFNVRQEDPERMGTHDGFSARSVFHSRYFHLVAQDKKFRYTKHRPQHVVDEVFLKELISRRQTTGHLRTLQTFLDLCVEIVASSA